MFISEGWQRQPVGTSVARTRAIWLPRHMPSSPEAHAIVVDGGVWRVPERTGGLSGLPTSPILAKRARSDFCGDLKTAPDFYY